MVATAPPLFNRGGANDRNRPEPLLEEGTGLRHDEVGLEILQPKANGEGRSVEVRKHQGAVGQRGQRRRHCITRLVVPGLKVRCLGWTDAEHDSQNLPIGPPQGQYWVQAAATLLDEAKMERR